MGAEKKSPISKPVKNGVRSPRLIVPIKIDGKVVAGKKDEEESEDLSSLSPVFREIDANRKKCVVAVEKLRTKPKEDKVKPNINSEVKT